MRLDKFLWSVRFYKTRNISAEEIKKNRVSIGGQIVKASREVKEGEIIEIRKNQINYKIKVIQIPKSRIFAKIKIYSIIIKNKSIIFSIIFYILLVGEKSSSSSSQNSSLSIKLSISLLSFFVGLPNPF